MNFAWDPRKEALNRSKHRVGFADAVPVFYDPLSVTFPDPAHSHTEQRYVTIGHSQSGNVLVIVHADQDETIRIISARQATRSERRFYEQG